MASSVRFDASQTKLKNQTNQFASSNQSTSKAISNNSASKPAASNKTNITSAVFSQLNDERYRVSPTKQQTGDNGYPSRKQQEVSGKKNDEFKVDSQKQNVVARGREGNQYAAQLFRSSDEGDSLEDDNYGAINSADEQEDGGDPDCGDSDFEPAEQSSRPGQYSYQHTPSNQGVNSLGYRDFHDQNRLLAAQYNFDNDSDLLYSSNFGDSIDQKLNQEHESSNYGVGDFRKISDNSDAIYRMRNQNKAFQNYAKDGYQNKNNFENAMDNKSSSSNFYSRLDARLDAPKTEMEFQPRKNTSDDYAPLIKPESSFQKYQDPSHLIRNKYAKQQIDAMERQNYLDSQKYSQSSLALGDTETVLIRQSLNTDRVDGSNKNRTFQRSSGAYQQKQKNQTITGQKSKYPEDDRKLQNQRSRNMSSDSSDESKILIDPEFRSSSNQYSQFADKHSIEMNEIKNQTAQQRPESKFETDYNKSPVSKNLTTVRNSYKPSSSSNSKQDKWQDSDNDDAYDSEQDGRFKSTGVGFSPDQVLARQAREKKKLLQDSRDSPSSSTERSSLKEKETTPYYGEKQQKYGSKTSGSERDSNIEQEWSSLSQRQSQQNPDYISRLNQYNPQFYPQKQQLGKESRTLQNSAPTTSTVPTTTQKKQKKKKEQPNEPNFLLTGPHAHFLDHRSFYRNTESLKQTATTAQQSDQKSVGSTAALREWFESLSVQDRVNSLTTTYPILVSSIIEAWQRAKSLSSPLTLFQIKKERTIDQTQTEAVLRRRNGQQITESGEYTIFERVPSENEYYKAYSYVSEGTQVREFQSLILKNTRITSNKQELDTLTVAYDFVKNADAFFSLIANATDEKAFSQPVQFVPRNGGAGKPVIETPKWINRSGSNYLGVWIVAVWEESLWAHFNFAKQVNIANGIRKNDLNQLFEHRSENLQNQEDLAKRWTELNEEGQKKLFDALGKIAKEETPAKFISLYEEHERRQTYSPHHMGHHYQGQEDLYTLYQPPRFGLYTYQEIPVQSSRINNDLLRQDFEGGYQSRAMNQYQLLDQQGHHNSQQNKQFMLMLVNNSDVDLKEIMDVASYVSSLELIKYISEIPLTEVNQKNYIRRHHLMRKMHELIQENLRDSIQNQLMNDLLAGESNNSNKNQTNAGDADDKAKKKRKNDSKNKKRKTGQVQQPQPSHKQTYQEKKSSISKSPSREIISQQPMVKIQSKETEFASKQQHQRQVQNQNQYKFESKEVHPGIASTTTSDDQTNTVKKDKKVTQHSEQSKNKKNNAPGSQQISHQKQEPQMPPVVDQSSQIQQIRMILNEIVESVCQIEEQQRREAELAEANEQLEKEKKQVVQIQHNLTNLPIGTNQEKENAQKITVKSDKDDEEDGQSKLKLDSEQADQKTAQNTNQSAQPAAKKRKRATKKKQDAQELINNFMRQLHGDPEEEQTVQQKNTQRNKQSNQAEQSQTSQNKKGQQVSTQSLNQNQQKQGTQTTSKNQNLKHSPQQQQQPRSRDQKNFEQKSQNQKPRTEVQHNDSKTQTQQKTEEETLTARSETQQDLRLAKKVNSDDQAKQAVNQQVLAGNNSNEKQVLGNNRKKLNETKTVQFFTIENKNIESTQFDQASGIFFSTSDVAYLNSAKFQQKVLETNFELQNEVKTTEPEKIQVEESVTAQSSQSAAPMPQREKISLTEHFLQAQGNYTTAFRDFRTTDDIYEKNTNIYENSKVKKIDYFNAPPQPVSLLDTDFKINQSIQPWLTNTIKPQGDFKEQPVEMSTTSVSFTPSLQTSPQISVKSEDQYSEKNVQNLFQPPQAQENQIFMQNLSPPLIKINSAFIQPSNQINDFNMYPQQLNFQQNYMGQSFEGQPYFKQQYSTPFQYQNQDPNLKQGYKKIGAPFRPPQNTYNTMPPKQPNVNNRSPTNMTQKQENVLQSYPSNESSIQNSRWHNNRGNKSTLGGISQSNQNDNGLNNFKPYSNDSQNSQIPQIRINAPVFDPYHQKQTYQQNNWPKMQNFYQADQQIEMQNPAMITNQTQFQRQAAMNQKLPVGNEKDYQYQQFEEAFYAQFDKNIAQTTKKIQKTIEKFEEERLYVLNKLQEMANKAFPGSKPVLKMFGSLMTGLALETSDMDIAVTGLRIEDRMAMIDDLHALESQVMKWSLVKELKAIDTASIPVIKAQLSLKSVAEEMGKAYNHHVDAELPIDITFDDSPIDPVLSQNNSNYSSPYSDYHRQLGSPQMLNNQMPLDPFTQLQSLFSSEFGLNIGNDSINPFGMDFGSNVPAKLHQGMISCNVLKEYVKTYPCLKEVALLLKRFLAVNNLNSAYQGGISSYSAVLLIVAYMNNFSLHKSPYLTPSRLLMGFLDFYSDCFDPKLYGVNTANGQSYYLLPHANQQMFIIVDPVQPTNNTARNSFRTPDVLSHFRAAFHSLKNLIVKEYQKNLEQDKPLKVETESVSQAVENVQQAQYLQNAAPFKTEKPGENQGTRQKQAQHKKIGAQPQQDQIPAKAQEQQHPHQLSSGLSSQTLIAGVQSLSGSIVNNTGLTKHSVAQAFSSVNFVDKFLSQEILKEGADGLTSKDESQKGSGAF